MKIGIEAQRIFRPDKHGMDFVILEVLRRLQRQKGNMNILYLLLPEKTVALRVPDKCT